MILNALDGKALPVYGDGKQVRDWLYVEDHASAIWLALTRGRIGETYNIGGLNERTNIEIVETICSVLDRKSPRPDGKSYATQVAYVADRPGHDRRYAIDSKKIRSELGWKPRETFDTGIEKTITWYLNNLDWAGEITAKKYGRERLGVVV
jgi:dTDP-glucose 4,6-dehydratase